MSTEPTTETTEHTEPLDPVSAALVKIETDAALPEPDALALRDKFAGYYDAITTLRGQAETITKKDDPAQQKLARTVRLGLKNVRCDVERTRKTLKDESLRRGKAIDGFANVLKYLCEPVEEAMMEVEQYAERQEAARIAALVDDRTRALVTAGADPTIYNLGAMDDATWVIVLDTARKTQSERVAAEQRAAAERAQREQAEAEERARVRAENERLRKERELIETEREKERQAALAKQRAVEEQARKEREAAETARKAAEAQARREREAAEARVRAEREAREKAEAEAAAIKRQAEERQRREREAAEARAAAEAAAAAKSALAPDREKLLAFADMIGEINVPELTTEPGKAVRVKVVSACTRLAEWVRKQAEEGL